MATNCDVNSLIQAARCFRCSQGMLHEIRTYLLCQWANAGGGGAPAAPLTNTIGLASLFNNVTDVWTQGSAPDNNLVYRSVNGAAYVLLATVAGATVSNTDAGPMAAQDLWCYKVQAKKNGLTSGFSPIACIGYKLFDQHSANIAYPDLVLVDSFADFSANGLLVTFSAPKLQQVNGNLLFGSASFISPVLTVLKTIGGNFDFSGCADMTSLALASLATVGGFIDLTGASALTAWSTPALTSVGGDFVLINNTACLTFNAPLLATAGGNLVVINTGIATMNLNALASVTGECDFINGAWATISLPALVSVNGGGGLMFQQNANLTTVTLAALTTVVTAFTPYSNPSLATLTLTHLATVGGQFDFSDNGSLVTLNLPALISVAADASYFGAGNGGSPANASGNFANLTIPNLDFTDGTRIDFNGCSLTAVSVQNILRRAVISGLANSTIDLGGGLNAGVASLNAQGQADFATLNAAPGNNVTLNP